MSDFLVGELSTSRYDSALLGYTVFYQAHAWFLLTYYRSYFDHNGIYLILTIVEYIA